ncbi:tyrosine-type recombinase/integrase [Acinetobacter indicus]|uniref:tyrosine-type recombinase/integrase n=2 Tax=Moraxellaceae TaxID=468 RepID=UPI002091B346|nr:integrase family protein [Acinetobacter indicus]
MLTNGLLEIMKLTKPAIDKIDCTGNLKPVFYWDDKVPGFGVKVTPKNSKSYVFQGRTGRQTHRIKIGDVDTWKLDDARKYAQELAIKCHKGIDPVAEKKKSLEANRQYNLEEKRKNIRFKEAWDEYLEERKSHWRIRTYQDHIELCRGGFDPVSNKTYKVQPINELLNLKLAELTADIFTNWLEINSYRSTTTSKAYRLVRAFLNWCEEHDDYENLIPTKSFKAKKVRQKVAPVVAKKDCLTKQQLPMWFKEIKKLENKKISTLLICTLITGCRKNELLTLKWSDVDFRWKTAKLSDKVEDNGRIIPLTSYVESLLLELKRDADSDFIFSSSKSKTGYIINPYKSLNKVSEKLEIEITPHGLRRSYETLAIWAKINPGILAQIAGHKPSALVDKHYTVRPMDMLREALQVYEDWILENAKQKE